MRSKTYLHNLTFCQQQVQVWYSRKVRDHETTSLGDTIVQAVSHLFSIAAAHVQSQGSHVTFVMDKEAFEQASLSIYSDFPS
jgi:hypothetical protein